VSSQGHWQAKSHDSLWGRLPVILWVFAFHILGVYVLFSMLNTLLAISHVPHFKLLHIILYMLKL